MTCPEVVLARCEDYSDDKVFAALKTALAPLNGLGFVKPGMKVAIKANLVSFLKPDAAATTHPALLCALVKMLVERGAVVTVGDSPGGLYTKAYVGHVYSATGVTEVERFGGNLNWNFEQTNVHFEKGAVLKDFMYTAYLNDADAIINFSKLKTHGMMAYSGAAKNMFGVIPGTIKPEYHFRFPNQADFADMIVDLAEYTKPVLSITDGVIGMEGNGPTMGTPRRIGVIGASFSPHKLDLACARIIGLGKDNVPTLQAAWKRGLIPKSADELDICGNIEDFIVPDFQRIENYNSILFRNQLPGLFGKAFGGIAQKALCSFPKVLNDECIGCGKCADICPAKAIHLERKIPRIERNACIHCFCCQEFCPKGAMKVKRPIVARVLNK
ncbi:MAG: DUF362 domain-containing protein [Clostridia bacterium]|nr:DUF362 domain-containing protein [Clostridia bacterium]